MTKPVARIPVLVASLVVLSPVIVACGPTASPEPETAPTNGGSVSETSPAEGEGAAPGEELPPDTQATGDCGGMTGKACAEGQFCNYSPEAACGAADQMGTCMDIPNMCTKDYRPVCGCDDKTYSNPCGAHSSGVSVARDGACEG